MSVFANAPIYQFWWEVPTSKRFLAMRDLEYESLATSAGRPACEQTGNAVSPALVVTSGDSSCESVLPKVVLITKTSHAGRRGML